MSGPTVTADFATTVRFLDTIVKEYQREAFSDGPASVLLAGPHSLASLRQVDLRNKIVLYIPPAEHDRTLHHAILRAVAAQSAGVVIVRSTDSVQFAAQQQAARAQPPRIADPYLSTGGSWVTEVWAGAVAKALDFNGLDLASLRTTTVPLSRPLPFLRMALDLRRGRVADLAMAPNVMAALVGSDLPEHYVVIAAPLDQRRSEAGNDLVGWAGLLALAKAFSQPGARPRRSLVFLGTSGGEEAWGGHTFMADKRHALPDLVVTVHLAGPLAGDSLAVDGVREVDVVSSPAWTAARHPELGLTVVDTGSVLTSASESVAFTSWWVPTLAVRAGGSGAPSARTHDAPEAAAAARYLQLIFYVIHALATDEQVPRWTSLGRQRLATPAP